MIFRNTFLFGLLIIFVSNCFGGISNHFSYTFSHLNEADSINFDRRRLCWLVGGKVVAFTGTMLVLDRMWYSEHPRTSFQFFNDNKHWKQMDKLGHVASAYHLSSASAATFRWAGLDNRQSAMYGSIAGTMFMSTIEILDGFSEEWGFSWGDQAANFTGSALFYFQQVGWESQKIKIRYSYRSSGLQDYRPDLFGTNVAEHMLKDYNGMTFWLSSNMNMFSKKQNIFPPWLNIAIGYSANGMLGSDENPSQHNGQQLPELERYRQWFISPDIDFSKISTDSQFLHVLFMALDFLKFPAPALEYNRKEGWRVHLLYF